MYYPMYVLPCHALPGEYKDMAIIKEDNGDASADSGTQYTLAVGDAFEGKLDPVNDKDWLQVELVAGTIYDIILNGVYSAQLTILDSQGNGIVYGKSNFDHTNIKIFSPDVSGTYYISIASTNSDFSADYEISLEENPITTVSYDEIADFMASRQTHQQVFDIGTGDTLTADITALNEAGQQLARWALEAWTSVTGIKFEFVDDGNAHITFDDNQDGENSDAYALRSTSEGFIVSSHVNVPADWLTLSGAGLDSYTFSAYLHEIGHALGLDHPGHYDSSNWALNHKMFLNDSWQTTVMSYFNQDYDKYVDASFAYPVTPMIADIIAIQNLYGVPVGVNVGDTVYGYGSNVDDYLGEVFAQWSGEGNTSFGNPVTLTLYDNGGNDTLDLRTDTTDQRVDLHPEGISDVYGLAGNLIIARDTLIENFIAGSGDDVVTGNAAANHLEGRDGDDNLQGNGGNDVLEGGAGADRLVGGTGTDSVSYFGSDTGVTVNLSDATVTGGHAEGDVIVEVENVRGSAYADILEGDESANGLDGGGGNDELRGNGDDDVLEGGAGADRLAGGAGEDTASYEHSEAGVTVRLHSGVAQGGDAEGDTFAAMVTVEYTDSNGGTQQEDVPDIEHLRGSAHDDVLAGDSRANRLEGGAGADRLYGGPGGGDDVLEGGTGEDALFGGSGDDILNGGADADMLKGGTGEDTASYAHSDAGVTIRLHSGVVLGGDAEGDVLDGIENVSGSAYADILEGDGNANRLDGADGADGLRGNGGDDVLEGGSGDDVLEGGAGADVLDGGAGTDWLSYAGSAAGVRVRLYDGLAQRGHAEGDTISGFENLRGSAHPDRLAGTGRANHLQGGAGNDHMWGGSGDDVLDGGAGADRFYGGPGADRITYRGSDAAVTVDLEDGTGEGGHAEGDVIVDVENIEGSDYDDTLTGHDGANRLEGGDGNDSLLGQGDHDVLQGGAGADRLDGGEGTDTVVYRNSNEAVTVNLSDATATGGHAAGDVIVAIENVEGSNYDDVLRGSNGANRLLGGSGNDELHGSEGDDQIFGDSGDDVLEGGFGGDRINGGAGSDTAVYRNSDAAVRVNLGNGTLTGGHAQGDQVVNVESIEGSNYDDVLIGDSAVNRLYGGAGKDELRGGDGDDQLFGNDGDDLLEGGKGIDRLDGGAGVDTVSYANAEEPVYVNLRFNEGSRYHYNDKSEVVINIENVIGSDYGDSLWGDRGANDLYGGGGNDDLNGGEGNDRLFGDAGDDELWGLTGADRLDGGEGVDIVVYWASDEAVTVNLEEGTGQGGHAQGDVLVNVENLWGSDHDDTLSGDNGANRLYGSRGNDELRGNGGNDVLEGDIGADRLDGGPGMDTVSYSLSYESVTVKLGEGLIEGGPADGDVFVSIEGVEGSNVDDVIGGDDGANRLSGGLGDDILEGGEGADQFIFDFSNGDDTILDFTDNEDLIDLTAIGLSGFDALILSSDSEGVTIHMTTSGGGTILLEGFDIANLDAADFIF